MKRGRALFAGTIGLLWLLASSRLWWRHHRHEIANPSCPWCRLEGVRS